MSAEAAEAPFDAAAEARRLMRVARHATLATLDRRTGGPYASLVSCATDVDGTPLLLVSRLAVHTRNLEVDPLVSILFAEIGAGDPLVHPRVSVSARADQDADPRSRRRFLARHPEAAMYAGFSDFSIYRLAPQSAHLVAGFGRIVDLQPADLLVSMEGAWKLAELEEEALAHVNADHVETMNLYATRLLRRAPGPWRMTGLDPEGFDLSAGDETARLVFPSRVRNASELREALQVLAERARSHG
ncbi:DUF2470 domain-containing protein [Alsobacter sp. SYSU M60028]|uniref:DUF2470 domain-containing protein n=1 Tax=Alsobacter ponti TaxID=2962936 RepID=A0ABT1LGJ9_9HYPH|nr:DUF2470 domain-containing protein [Alsobacter ponti]MCP8940554.1 DUF2470 domain-containing protein [Alsobacter ponti]